MCTSGCATILNDATQPVAFSSEPQGAIVTVNGAAMGRTPCTLPIARKGWDKEILFTLDGHKPLNFKLKNSLDGAVAGNIIAGGVIGGIVDGISGRGGGYQESVQVVLVPSESSGESRVVEVDFKYKDGSSATEDSTVTKDPKLDFQPANQETRKTNAISMVDLSPGEGRSAERGDEVEYRYVCKLPDGTLIFDSDASDGKTRKRLAGAATKPNGLGEALIGTRAGMIRKATVPPERAFGAQGRAKSKIPPNATLIFEIRVVSVNDPPMP
jgi:FKBP-type peptidyl-prolyl cis-trans isomerase